MSENTTDGNKAEPRRKVGDILRDARIVRDQELKEVAKALAIRLPFMEAIEDSRPNDLPGAAYALGFVRSYADYLGMDSKALVERYKEEAKELEHETSLHFPEPLPSRKVPIGALLFIGIILVLLFYGVWWYLNNQGKNLADIVPALSSEQSEMAKTTTQETSPTMVEETVAEVTSEVTVEAETAVQAVVEKTEEAMEVATEAVSETTNEVVDATAVVAEEVSATTEEAVTEVAETIEQAAEPAVSEVIDTSETSNISTDAVEAVEEVITTASPTTEPETAAVIADAAVTETITQSESVPEETAEVISEVAEEIVEEVTEVAEAASEATSVTNTADAEVVANDVSPETSAASSSISNERKERVYGEENTGSRVTILAKESAWVEVSDASGELTLTRLLRKGDRYLVPNQSGLTMVTGNAGGIYILVDDKEIGPSGPIGAVRRDFPLDADSLLATQSSENTSNTSN